MSFSFGFTSNDLSDDELDGDTVDSTMKNDASNNSQQSLVNPLDSQHLLASNVVQPSLENVTELIKSLVDVRVSFEKFQTPQSKTVLYRRELFDVKHQLMSEADDLIMNNQSGKEASDELEILMGETSEDLRKNVYEGGLKSWECSIDLVDTLYSMDQNSKGVLDNFDTVLEIGCGTSLPTEYLFMNHLKQGNCNKKSIILADYNKSVLRLVTLPNLIVSWAKTVLTDDEWVNFQRTSDANVPVTDDELLLTSALLEKFVQDMIKVNLNITLMSGSWGRKLNNIFKSEISASCGLLVLTSETIYQPENLPVVAETVLDLIATYKPQLPNVACLLAAKDIYFGVGGSIVEFEEYVNLQLSGRFPNIQMETFKVNAGLKRSVTRIF